jgi:hypothetical protein
MKHLSVFPNKTSCDPLEKAFAGSVLGLPTLYFQLAKPMAPLQRHNCGPERCAHKASEGSLLCQRWGVQFCSQWVWQRGGIGCVCEACKCLG